MKIDNTTKQKKNRGNDSIKNDETLKKKNKEVN